MGQSYLSVTNLSKYQHYKHRTPPWVKLHNCILDDADFCRLQDASKWLAVGCILLASRTGNRIPDDAKWIGHQLWCSKPPDVEVLVNAGFLTRASNMLACCVQDACSEREESRVEGETESPPTPSRGLPAAAGKSSSNGERKPPETTPGFSAFWEAWRGTGRATYKNQALANWKKLKLEPYATGIVDRLLVQIEHKRAMDERKQFCPPFQDPHRWLKNARWKDELPEDA